MTVEQSFLNQMAVVLVRDYAPRNNFQKAMVRYLSPLHGMCIQTERIPDLFADIKLLVNVLEHKYPRHKTRATLDRFLTKTDLYGHECKAMIVKDEGFNDVADVASVFVMPFVGMQHAADVGACQRMFALPFCSDKIPWAMKYNNFTDPVM